MRNRIEQVLGALDRAGVRYMVVGGVAVVLHGHLRTTLDLDLVIQLEPENLEKALKTFADLGFHPRVPVPLKAFADPQTRENWSRDKNMTVFSLERPDEHGFAVDLFVKEPFDFEEVYGRALVVPLQETRATVISLPDLIAMKQAVGRDQDLLDIKALKDLVRASED
jgi:predicted nucleotidyltransferase